MTAEISEPSLVHAPSPVMLKLDLGGGRNPREGYECVDLYEGAKHRLNILRYPWPFADNSVASLHCSHFIEHIYAGEVHDDGLPSLPGEGQDALLRFFDECYRVLVPGGDMTVQVPCHRSDRAFWDPTHRRFITAQTFLYLNKEWRDSQGLGHYNVKCNFAGNTGSVFDAALAARHPEAQARLMNECWNTVIDWKTDLVSLKPGTVETR